MTIMIAALSQSMRIEVNQRLLRDYVKRDLQALEKLKIDKITEAVFNKNIDIEYNKIRFSECEDCAEKAFEVLVDASTRKGHGQIIAKFVVAIKYEIMPSEIMPVKVEVR